MITAANSAVPAGLKRAEDAKLEHEQVAYTAAATGDDVCRRCRNFVPLDGDHCEIVKDPIAPGGWCKLFTPMPLFGATDSALRLAFDRESVRTMDRDGRMRVAVANISKANVCPYLGKEIPGWKELGLEPDRVYNLLRHPDELAKAAPSFNGVQLLRKHTPVNADDHRKHDIVGTTGTDAEFDGTYLKNSLIVWSKEGIDLIESGEQRELSPGYHYRPVMTPGNFDGMPYDGVMTEIVGNHVALVEDGRTGPDVVVGDSAEDLKQMKPTRLAAHALQLTAAAVGPLLAQDAKIELPKDLFAQITSKNLKDSASRVVEGVKLAVDGKLRRGVALDNAIGGVKKVFDALEELAGSEKGVDESVSEPQHKAMEAAAHGTSTLGIPQSVGQEYSEADKGKTFDAEPIKAFLKEKGMADDDVQKVCDMLPKTGMDESPEEKEAREKKEAEDKAAKDAEMTKDMVSKGAMDAALKAHGEAITKQVREGERAIRAAIGKVEARTGKLEPSLAFDSASDVFRHALKMLGVSGAEKLHVDALEPVFDNLPRPEQRQAPKKAPAMALDQSHKAFHDEIGVDLSRIGIGA